MRRGAELMAAVVAAVGMGLVGPGILAAPAAAADTVVDARVDQLAVQLGGLDTQVRQLETALQLVDRELETARAMRDDARSLATSRQQLQARLIAQARAYAVQRYIYGSTDGTDLLAFLAALDKPADDATWGLATLEIASAEQLDQAQRVAKARADIADRLAILESDVLQLTDARTRRAQLLTDTKSRRAAVANQFAGAIRDLGQATVNGMTTVAYDAYQHAQDTLAIEQPACGLRWELLAAIGKTESNHGAGRLDAAGDSLVPIIGIPIGPDSDGGLLDGDPVRDHAVGPMQFLPSTWVRWGTDANGDGKKDPGNIIDAATAAGRYLCRAAGSLTLETEPGVIRAILSYNPNPAYLRVVGARFQALASDLAAGWFSAASLPTPPPPDPGVTPNAPVVAATAAVPLPVPPPPPPPATKVVAVAVFTATGLAIQTKTPLPQLPASCLGPSLMLSGRAGFLRCQPSPPSALGVLDPCQAAPYDATLVACLPDPTALPTLLRLAPQSPRPPTVSLGPPPPFRLLVLDGADRCLPIPAAAPPPTAPPGSTTTTAPPRATTTSSTSAPGSRGSTTTTPTTSPTSNMTTSTSTTTAGATTSSTAATSTPRRRAHDPTTTEATTSTTTATKGTTTSSTAAATTSTTAAATTTTIPLPERPTYACASGVTVIGLPDQSSATWTVRVRQPGLADRVLVVLQAYR